MKKLDYIDALRGIAIIGVVVVHSSQYGSSKLPWYLVNFINEGARGVQLFFIASAFTLFLSFKNRINSERSPIINFFIRRFFRIAPMYYIGIFYYLWQNNFSNAFMSGGREHSTVLLIISNLTFTHGMSPYYINSLVPGGWSIAVEFMFYGMMPLLFFVIKNITHSFNFFIITIVINAFLKIYMNTHYEINDTYLWQEFLFFYIFNQLPVFSLGLIFYFLVIENKNLNNVNPTTILMLFLLIFCSICTPSLKFFPDHIVVSIGFLFLSYSLSKHNFLILNNQLVRYIGKISFSLYIVHFAILYWLTNINFVDYFGGGLKDYIIRLFITLILSIIVSSFFYRCVEEPFQKISKKIISKLN